MIFIGKNTALTILMKIIDDQELVTYVYTVAESKKFLGVGVPPNCLATPKNINFF